MANFRICSMRLLACAPLVAALGCGGGSSSTSAPAATALSYTGPTDPTQWRLVQDASSTPTHLVLNLMAPTGARGMGVTLVLSVDGSRASWSSAWSGSALKPGGYYGPLAQRASIAGSDLRILLSQMNPTPPMNYLNDPVLTVALDLASGAPVGTVALAATQGGHLAAPLTLPVAVAIQTGTLKAQ